jgi:hypothetical protein
LFVVPNANSPLKLPPVIVPLCRQSSRRGSHFWWVVGTIATIAIVDTHVLVFVEQAERGTELNVHRTD